MEQPASNPSQDLQRHHFRSAAKAVFTSGRTRSGIVLLYGLLTVACGPTPKAGLCEYSGDIGGSTKCAMSHGVWSASSNRSSLALESLHTENVGIKISMLIEGAPRVAEFALDFNAIGSAVPEEAGCGIWLFLSPADPFDSTRDSARFGPDPSAKCNLRITELELLSDDGASRVFEVHGTLHTKIAGGVSSMSHRLKTAILLAGF